MAPIQYILSSTKKFLWWSTPGEIIKNPSIIFYTREEEKLNEWINKISRKIENNIVVCDVLYHT